MSRALLDTPISNWSELNAGAWLLSITEDEHDPDPCAVDVCAYPLPAAEEAPRRAAAASAERAKPRFLSLAWLLPGLPGVEFCRVRAREAQPLPILTRRQAG